MNIQARRLIRASIVISLLSVLVFVLVISTQSTDQINFLDNYWYLNRARLIWQGVLPDLFVYTLAYPTFVGVIDFVVHDAILSGMIANAVMLWLILVGVYILAYWLYGRGRVAWLAVILVALNASVLEALRLFWGTVPFMAVNVWIVIAALLVVRRPSLSRSVLLGGLIALAAYTRVEGAVYSIAIPIAAGIVCRQQQNWRLAAWVLFVGGLVLVLLCIPFALNFVYINRNIDRELSDSVTGIVSLVNRTPIEWFVIWRRVTDTLTGMLSHWPIGAWLVGIAGVIWASPRIRRAQLLCWALIGFNAAYAFGLAIWPGRIHIIFYVPFLALILAATLDQLLQQTGWTKYFAYPMLALIITSGVLYFVTQATTFPVMAYRTSELAETGKALDEWIEQEGWKDSRIYTFCTSIPSFSRANFQLIYRLQFTTGWDRPERLLSKMDQENALLMLCGTDVSFVDWHPLLIREVPPGLQEVGRFQNYIFYRPNGM